MASVACSEWVPYESADSVVEAGRRAYPELPVSVLTEAPQFPYVPEVCHRVWHVPKAPAAQRKPTTSAIPTLVIAGGEDAITSSQTAEKAARLLPKSTFIVLPGASHVAVLQSPCGQKVLQSFLSNPSAPDTSCVSGLKPPPFTIEPKR